MPDTDDLELGILEGAYREVLDATKHQDDKIGRLFTGVSFLTAATFALAGLAENTAVIRRFEFSPFVVPLALMFLLAFLVLVLLTVSLLIASFSTPLRVPGLEGDVQGLTSVGSGLPVSQLYFYDIAKVTRREWRDQWATTSGTELRQNRKRNLLNEIHNLAVRTSFKYDRSTEAIGIFVVALLTFAVSAILLVTAMNTPGATNIVPGAALSVTLSLLFSGYMLLVLLNRFRYDSQDVDGEASVAIRRPRQTFVGTLIAVPWLLLVPVHDKAVPWLAATLGLLAGLNFWSFGKLNPTRKPGPLPSTLDPTSFFTSVREREVYRRVRRRKWLLAGGTAVFVAASVSAIVSQAYFWQFLVAFFTAVSTTIPGLISPTTEMKRRRREMQQRAEWARRTRSA